MPDRDDDGAHFPRHMCAVCHARLNAKEDENGNFVKWMHGVIADHDPRPVPEVTEDTILVCDFCLAEHPTWDMPCGPMTPVQSAEADTLMISVSDWAACTACKDCVVEERYQDLVERIFQGQKRRDPEMGDIEKASPAMAMMMRLGISRQMADFRAARTGPPVPIIQAIWIASKLREITGEQE